MRIYLFLAILGLIAVEAFLAPRTVRDFRIMDRMRHENAADDAQPAAIGPFAGYGADGRPVTLVNDDTRWIVPFVIHSSRLAADLDYGGRLRKALPDGAIVLVGLCDQAPCGPGPSPFPILAYGSYASLLQIGRYDDRNQVLLLNQFWGVRKPLNRVSSPEEMAAEIQKVIGQ